MDDKQHNKPPEPVMLPTGQELADQLYKDLGVQHRRAVEAGEIADNDGPKPPSNNTEAKMAVAQIKSLQVTKKQLQDGVKAIKKPYQDANKAIKLFEDENVADLEAYRASALSKLASYMEVSGETSITSDYGNTASFQERSELVINIDELPTEFQKVVPDDAAIKASLKEGKGVRGVTINTIKTLVVS